MNDLTQTKVFATTIGAENFARVGEVMYKDYTLHVVTSAKAIDRDEQWEGKGYFPVAHCSAEGWKQAKEIFTTKYPSVMKLYGDRARVAITEGYQI